MGKITPHNTPTETNAATESTADTSADTNNAEPSAEEIAGVVAELEQYRKRLEEDFTATAKKAKLPKSMAMSQLKNHPEILKIDAALAKIRGEQPIESVGNSANDSVGG